MDRYLLAMFITLWLNRYRDPKRSREVTPQMVLEAARAGLVKAHDPGPTPEDVAMAQKAMLRALGDAATQGRRRPTPRREPRQVIRPVRPGRTTDAVSRSRIAPRRHGSEGRP